MKIDLAAVAGFPLELDTEALEIVAGDGIRFDRDVRRKPQMQDVLMEPDAIADDTPLYYNLKMASGGQYTDVFRRYNLTFACVLLPPLKIGREHVKTHGHYHPKMPGSSLSYPEVYTHYYGKLYLLMHRRTGDDPARLDDCLLYEMRPGHSITIPPGYLHVLINPSDEPALMGGLYCPDSYPEYEPVVQMRGAAFYVLNGSDGEQIVPNTRYQVCPPLVRLGDLSGSVFAPPRASERLWASFVREPQAYAMLSDAGAAERYFNSEVMNRSD